jgi:hypothetical protein
MKTWNTSKRNGVVIRLTELSEEAVLCCGDCSLKATLDKVLNSNRGIAAAFAGGAEFEGIFLRFGTLQNGGSGIKVPSDDEHYKLGKYLKSTGLYFMRRRITREDVIKYVANKLGGAHLDFDTQEPTYEALENANVNFNIMGKTGVFFELLSIGQLLTNSPSIAKLVERLNVEVHNSK